MKVTTEEIVKIVKMLKKNNIPPLVATCSICGKTEEVYTIGSGEIQPYICSDYE